jgi:hypothetical protein
MRRYSIIAAATLTGLLAPTAAAGETRLLEVPSRYLVIPASEAHSLHLRAGDAILDVPLRWRSAAVLSQPAQLIADDRRENLKPGQALAETRLQFDDPKFAQAASFCVPRLADPMRKSPWLGSPLGSLFARSATDGQFCLIDVNRDGKADHSVLINAGSANARMPVAISEIPYVLTPGAAVSEGDSFKISYGGGSFFDMEMHQQGKLRRFDFMTFKSPSGQVKYNNPLKIMKMPDGSIRVSAPGVTFGARNFDKASKTVDIDWPAIPQPIAMPIPDEIRRNNGVLL